MFDGSEYKDLFCEKLKLKGDYSAHGSYYCAVDPGVGEQYCQGFATLLQGYDECHGWPGYMFLYCGQKQTALVWDSRCANHTETGAAYCEDFALDANAQIYADCVRYNTYMTLFCDNKAKHNISNYYCGSDERVRGSYCGKMALQMNGLQACWSVPSFDVSYCNEITWGLPACESIAGSAHVSDVMYTPDQPDENAP